MDKFFIVLLPLMLLARLFVVSLEWVPPIHLHPAARAILWALHVSVAGLAIFCLIVLAR